jgi:hypothetical protein
MSFQQMRSYTVISATWFDRFLRPSPSQSLSPWVYTYPRAWCSISGGCLSPPSALSSPHQFDSLLLLLAFSCHASAALFNCSTSKKARFAGWPRPLRILASFNRVHLCESFPDYGSQLYASWSPKSYEDRDFHLVERLCFFHSSQSLAMPSSIMHALAHTIFWY